MSSLLLVLMRWEVWVVPRVWGRSVLIRCEVEISYILGRKLWYEVDLLLFPNYY